ncbi:MAG: ATP-binding protein [Myxococcota bacterium]
MSREIVLWFEIPSQLSVLDELWTAVQAEICQELRVDSATLIDFRLALVEATSNAIVHGHGEDGRTLHVEVRAAPDKLEAAVHDSGPGFPFEPEPPLPANEAEAGRGLWMMEQLLDEIRYEREGGKNIMRLALDPRIPRGHS